MIVKEMLITIIEGNGNCFGIGCFDCPISEECVTITNGAKTVLQAKTGRKVAATNKFIQLYNKEDLMEMLL